MPEATFYRRHQYAKDTAEQLLRPIALQLQVCSGIFLSGIRCIGKTTFLQKRSDTGPGIDGGIGDQRGPLG